MYLKLCLSCPQYGNTYLPELNLVKPTGAKQRLAGGGTMVQGFQVFFVLLYTAVLTLSVATISLTMRCDPDRALGTILDLLVPLGMIGLGSAIHTIPEGPPFSYLLWWLRLAMAAQLVSEASVLRGICRDYDETHGDDAGR
jgi:hypothetical protein